MPPTTVRKTPKGAIRKFARKQINEENFDRAVFLAILIATVLVGLQTYPQYENNPIVIALDVSVILVFIAEVILKMLAHGVLEYFIGPEWRWNVFDFGIVVGCIVGFTNLSSSSAVLPVLRLFRLLRVAKLVDKIPQLQMVLLGMLGGLASMGYIVLLLMLVMFVFGCTGVIAFRNNDPFNFGSLIDAILMLWSLCTLDWADTMYFNMYGCQYGEMGSVYRVVRNCSLLESDVANNLISPMHDSFTFNDTLKATSGDSDCQSSFMFYCFDLPPDNATNGTQMPCAGTPYQGLVPDVYAVNTPRPVSASCFFMSFVVGGAWIMLSLFMGAVTTAMGESMKVLREKKEHSLREKSVLQSLRRQRRLLEGGRGESGAALLVTKVQCRLQLAYLSVHEREQFDQEAEAQLAFTALSSVRGRHVRSTKDKGVFQVGQTLGGNNSHRHQHSAAFWLRHSPSAMHFLTFVALRPKRLPDHLPDQPPQTMNICERCEFEYGMLALRCEAIVKSARFRLCILTAILLVAIVVGLQTVRDLSAETKQALFYAEMVILVVFILEALLTITSEGFKPWKYFTASTWNCFDFTVILISLFETFLGGEGTAGNSMLFRLLRVLRVFKLMRSVPALNVVLSGLMDGIQSSPSILLMLVLVYFVFGVLAVNIFGEHDPFHFGTLHVAVISLFQASTMDGWTELMLINQLGCDKYGYKETGMPPQSLCEHPKAFGYASAVFFVTFVVVSGLVLLSLFLGVVTISMDVEQERAASEHARQKRVREVVEQFKIPDKLVHALKRTFDMIDSDGSKSLIGTELLQVLQAMFGDMGEDELWAFATQVGVDHLLELPSWQLGDFIELVMRIDGQSNNKGNNSNHGHHKGPLNRPHASVRTNSGAGSLQVRTSSFNPLYEPPPMERADSAKTRVDVRGSSNPTTGNAMAKLQRSLRYVQATAKKNVATRKTITKNVGGSDTDSEARGDLLEVLQDYENLLQRHYLSHSDGGRQHTMSSAVRRLTAANAFDVNDHTGPTTLPEEPPSPAEFEMSLMKAAKKSQLVDHSGANTASI